MNNPKRHLVTSALPYANGPLHIGHIAGAYLPADIYVKFLRMAEEDVVYVCGSDEHGAAITLRAKKEGISPREIIDKYHEINKKAFEEFGIEFDIYHRTSSELHHETAAGFFKVLDAKGVFEIKETEQFYDEKHHQFLADRYVTGTCPKCGFENAYGDQCEKCGSALSPTELIDPKSTLSGETPVLRKTKHWYLPMNEDEGWLREWITKGTLEGKPHHDPTTWRRHVVGQCMSWIDGGLSSRAMTRDLDWGVKVPVEGAEGKVLYVWLDAPIGYISATKQWAQDHGKNWEDYWCDENTHLTHFIAKDNIVFHCIIFPILLKRHGGFNLPVNVPANEFLNLEGDKISTSREWAVWLHEYLQDFPGKRDELRYVLTSISPENKDSEFTWKDYQTRVNNELVAILGNFVNRSLVLTQKYFEGKVPFPGEFSGEDLEVFEALKNIPEKVEKSIRSHRYKEALFEAVGLARMGNKYLAESEPWKLWKTNPDRVKTILYVSDQIVANIAIVLRPFLPDTCDTIAGYLHIDNKQWKNAGRNDLIPEGTEIGKPGLLFEKIEDAVVARQVEKLKRKKAEMEDRKQETTGYPEQKELIDYEMFSKLDMRLGMILEAEKVPKADKLLKLTVDTGIDQRTIVSGIAHQFEPKDLIGRQVVVLINLEPRKIRGVESQGMLLLAEDNNGRLQFISAGGNQAGPIVS